MRLAAVLTTVALTACNLPSPNPVPPPPPPVDVDAPDVERVCNRLRQLGCRAGETTPEGATCEDVLRNAAQNGIDLVGDVECVESASTCEQASACD